jgi:hypothetical protein
MIEKFEPKPEPSMNPDEAEVLAQIIRLQSNTLRFRIAQTNKSLDMNRPNEGEEPGEEFSRLNEALIDLTVVSCQVGIEDIGYQLDPNYNRARRRIIEEEEGEI